MEIKSFYWVARVCHSFWLQELGAQTYQELEYIHKVLDSKPKRWVNW